MTDSGDEQGDKAEKRSRSGRPARSGGEGVTGMVRDVEDAEEWHDVGRPLVSIRLKIGLVTMGLAAMGLASFYVPGDPGRLFVRPVHIWIGLLSVFVAMVLPGPIRSTREGRGLLSVLLTCLAASSLVLVLVDSAWPEPCAIPDKEAKGLEGVVWDRVLKSEGKESAAWLGSLPNGDYVAATSTARDDQSSQLTVWEINCDGDTIWEKKLRISFLVTSTIVLDSGGLLVTGGLSSDDGMKQKVYLARIGAGQDGSVLWERTYAGEETWHIETALQADDGGFLLGGFSQDLEKTQRTFATSSYSETRTGYERDMLILKTDGNGDQVWSRTWDQVWDDQVQHIQMTADGGYLLWGPGRPEEGIYVAKIDDSGELVWEKNTKLEYEISRAATCATMDGGFALAHYHPSPLPGNSIYVVELDSEGDLEWERRYPVGERYLSPQCVAEAPEGGIVVFCEEYGPDGYRPSLMYILKVEENGEARQKELKIELDLDSVTPIMPAGQGYILAGTPIIWMIGHSPRAWYGIDVRLMRIDVGWVEEEVFILAREEDPTWANFPIHGEEPAAADLERGYRLIQQNITCTVYCTADFVRINHHLAVEILNKSLDRIRIKVPYGANEITRIEEIQPSAQLACYKSAQLDVEVEQDEEETVISIILLPEMLEKGKAMIYMLYRVFDLPGGEGVLAFDEAYREGNARWEKGTLVNYSPGSFDQGTWNVNFKMIPNSDRIVPTYWEPAQATQATEENTNFHSLRWQYTGEILREPAFKAIYSYPS